MQGSLFKNQRNGEELRLKSSVKVNAKVKVQDSMHGSRFKILWMGQDSSFFLSSVKVTVSVNG